MTPKRSLVAVAAAAVTALACAVPAARAADPCPNAAYRSGAGANLPDCRAWEQVTPADKNGNQVRDFAGAFAAPDGNSVLSYSTGDMGGADGLPFQGVFSSVRQGGWSTFGVGAPFDPPLIGPGIPLVTQSTLGFSEDRSKVVTTSTHKLTADAVEGDSNVYVRDTRSRAYELLATASGPQLTGSLLNIARVFDAFYGGSPDLEHSVIRSDLELEPNAQGGGLYELSGGRISLVTRGLDNNPLGGIQTIDGAGSGPRVVSDDGRRVTFRAYSPDSNFVTLYQRVDGTATKLISRSYRTGAAPDAAVAVTGGENSAWPSADGREITFATTDQTTLTDAGTPAQIYRWNADRDTVADVFDGVSRPWGPSADGFLLLRVSPDGRYVWFTFRDPDAASSGRELQLGVLDTQRKQITIKAGAPQPFVGVTRFSTDGTKMIAQSNVPLTGYDQSGGPCASVPGGSCSEAFYFDATDGRTAPICASCGQPGTSSAGDVGIGAPFPGRPVPTIVSNTGRAFFDTVQRLVPADANGQRDVYGFTPGQPAALISSGTGADRATVLGTSSSGDDAFFFTGNALVPQDEDRGAVDVYDARVGGGLAEQQRTAGSTDPCPTASCPAAQPATPAAEVPGTSTFQAPPRAISFRVARVSAAVRRAAVSSGRLRLSVTVGAAGKIAARATARFGKRTASVGTATTSARRSGRYSLSLKLSRAARRALARERKLGLKLSVSYSRASRPQTQSVALTAPRTRGSAKGGAR